MESGRLPGQACDVPILQARQNDGAFVPGRPPLPTAPLPFRFLFAAFFMAPGGQAAQGGLPEPKLEWIQLPTVSNLPGAGALRAWAGADHGVPRGGRKLSGAALGMAARGQKLGDRVATRPQWTPESKWREHFGGETELVQGEGGA